MDKKNTPPKKPKKEKKSKFLALKNLMGSYFTIRILIFSLLVLSFALGVVSKGLFFAPKPQKTPTPPDSYWFVLLRQSNIELLYKGNPGDSSQSKLVKAFKVKSGVPQERPTPLPQKLGRKYWVITKKELSDNPETAPYFITLNVPGIEEEPFGPTPYMECNGQCNWILPGAFGLHGINGDIERISETNLGSSGCIRHTDTDITYLYNLLNPDSEEIRYYIEDI